MKNFKEFLGKTDLICASNVICHVPNLKDLIESIDLLLSSDGTFVFDELGLKSWNGTVGTGKLLTHVVFHPVQKSLNRLIQIDYTVRIQTLTNLSTIS